jgi:glutamine amidotransferase
MPQICIVDYGMGNLLSVVSAFQRLGYYPSVGATPEAIAQADALVLPGVGAFPEAMRRLNASGLVEALNASVLKAHVPILGICLGMQLFARESTEGGMHKGLGWIDTVVELIPEMQGWRVPHTGWNDVQWTEDTLLNVGLQQGAHFYFNHSYSIMDEGPYSVATAGLSRKLVAAVVQDNIFGVQFHPEKSQVNGLRVLRSFTTYVEERLRKAA